jgi:hypothetical protein
MKRGILIALQLGVVASMPAMAGSLSGTVIDRTTSLPIPGAIVTVHVLLPDSIAYPDTSDETGDYGIEGIVPGNQIYVVMAGKPGYRGYYFRYDEIGSDAHTLDIVLEAQAVVPPGGGGDSSEISGQVLGREGPSGELSTVPGAELRFSSGTESYLALTDLQGEYRTKIPRGSYAVTASAAGYREAGSAGVTAGPGGLIYGAVLVRTVTEVEGSPDAPEPFALLGAYPNPFNPTTRIRYTIPATSRGSALVSLTVHDMLGQQVAELVSDHQGPGTYEVVFDASSLAGGVYFCRLSAGSYAEARRSILLK